MTTLQLKVAIKIEQLGSISAASNDLNISQPNASNYLKSLESEIGFNIFERTKNGVSVTLKGASFLKHAKKILDEQESIMEIKKQDEIYRLRLGTIYYKDAIEPFIKLCAAHRDDFECDFRYYSVSVDEGVNLLKNYSLDVLFSPVLVSQISGLKDFCKKNNFSLISLKKLPAVINLRKNHPAILDGTAYKVSQGCDLLKDYPYISYRSLKEDSTSTGYNDSDFIQCSYKIVVDEVDVKNRLIESTNGFSFGMSPSKAIKGKYEIEAIPISGIYLEVFVITREGDLNKKEIKEYIDLVKEQIE